MHKHYFSSLRVVFWTRDTTSKQLMRGGEHMTIEYKNGFIIISDIVNNQLITRKYMGYTKREAIKKFKSEIYEAIYND